MNKDEALFVNDDIYDEFNSKFSSESRFNESTYIFQVAVIRFLHLLIKVLVKYEK